MVYQYQKGYKAENELQHKFSKMGWCVIRAPRSGRIGLPSPDLIAAKNGNCIVIECKSSKNAFSINKEQLDQLKYWEDTGGTKAYVAWKMFRKGWKFFHLKDVFERQGRMSKKFAEEKAFDMEEVI